MKHIPFPIIYTMGAVQDVAQGILDTQRIPQMETIDADIPVCHGIPEWVLQDRNIAQLISLHERKGYVIGFFEDLSAPVFMSGFAYYSGKTLYYIRYRTLKYRIGEYQDGKLHVREDTVAGKRGEIDFQYWDIPEERIPDILDLEKLRKEGWNLSAGIQPFLPE